MSNLYDTFKEAVKFVTVQSIGAFWAVLICIPLVKDVLIKREDVFTIKDRSSYLERLYTERSDFGYNTLTLDGKTFHYAEVGDASKPLVLFLHGFPEFWYTWRHQLRGLRNMDYHLVALDMRGAGKSYKPREVHHYQVNLLLGDIRGIIQKLSPNGRAACVVGHDWGSLISWQAAAQSWEWDQYQDHSGFIDRLIIINCPHAILFFQNFNGRLIDAFHYRNLKSLVCNPISTLSLSWQTIRPCIDQFKASYYTFVFNLPFQFGEHWFSLRDLRVFDLMFKDVPKENVSDEDINIYKATFSSDNHACLTGGINYYRSNALKGFFNEQEKRGIPQPGFIGIPTLVIWGDKDLYIKKELSLPNLEKFVSNLKVVHLPDAGHFVQEECPDRVNDVIRKFITSHHDLDENMEY